MGSYRIKIVNGNDEFEVEGDKKFVIDMWKNYQGKGKPQRSTDGKVIKDSESKSRPSKELSVGEFVRSLNLKKHTDFVLAFGYYLEINSGHKEFAPADINACYYDAKLEASNTSQMIIQNIKRGYMMQAKKDGEKRYVLTQSGVDYIKKLSSK